MATGVELQPIDWMNRNTDWERILDESTELVEVTKELIQDSGRFLPDQNDFDYCMALTLSRFQRFSRSITVLLYEGNMQAALVLLRAVYEDLFQLAYMATDKEKLGSQCRKYIVINGLVHLQWRRKIGGAIDAELRSQLDEVGKKYSAIINEFTKPKDGNVDTTADPLDRKYFNNWTKLNLHDVAQKANLKFYFETIYESCLPFVHGAMQLFHDFAAFGEDGRLEEIDPNRPPDDEELRSIMRDLTWAHLLLTETLCNAYNVECPDRIRDLKKSLSELVTAH